jgi:arylsulfatase A-like enzyme
MERRDFLKTSLPAGILPQAAAQTQRPAGGVPKKPNILWLFGDQHRAQALGFNGDPNAVTPHLDTLAREGVVLPNAISGAPLCCPFRGSLVTGLYAHKCVPGHEYPLPDGQKTVADVFNDNGYHTGYFGKWHLGGWHERDGRGAHYIIPVSKRGGFKTWIGYENNNSQYDSWVHGGEGREAFHYRLPGYETDELTNLLLKYLDERKQKGEPFFAALSVQPPHDPYVAPPEYMTRYNPAKLEMRANVPNVRETTERARRELAGYYAMIENWDANVGRVVAALRKNGQWDNTHVVFFSDHGDMHGSQGMYRKTNPYEESIRVPFILSGGQARYEGWKNGRSETMMNHVDIAPTSLGLAGIRPPAWMQGRDLSHVRIDRPGGPPAGSDPDSAYAGIVVPTGHGDSINKAWRGVITKDGWKYCCFDNQTWLLHNLNEDPFEQVNLAHNNRYRAVRKKLADRMRQWAADTGDKFNVPAE